MDHNCRNGWIWHRCGMMCLLLDQILADGRHCLLQMTKVDFIDSTGMGLLIRLQRKIRATGRQLVLLDPSPTVKRALALMRLQDFFASAPDFASAQRLIETRTLEQKQVVSANLTKAMERWSGRGRSPRQMRSASGG